MKISLTLQITRGPKPAPAVPSAPEVDDKGFAYIESAPKPKSTGFNAITPPLEHR